MFISKNENYKLFSGWTYVLYTERRIKPHARTEQALAQNSKTIVCLTNWEREDNKISIRTTAKQWLQRTAFVMSIDWTEHLSCNWRMPIAIPFLIIATHQTEHRMLGQEQKKEKKKRKHLDASAQVAINRKLWFMVAFFFFALNMPNRRWSNCSAHDCVTVTFEWAIDDGDKLVQISLKKMHNVTETFPTFDQFLYDKNCVAIIKPVLF